jgi:glucan 1,3-beta-glucosidase
MNNTFLRGVNLGGWLLLEKWMTPSLFAGMEAIDEYTFMQTPGAAKKIDEHRKTFITESDFKWLAEYGVNAVRIPVGYWALEGYAPYVEATTYLDWAMSMAEQYRLEVIIDVHGLPGSQNGRDHSGRVGKALWYRSADDRRRSVDAVVAIAERYKESSVLWGIQVANEPRLGLLQWKLRRYYHVVYRALGGVLSPETRVIVSDAFTPRLMSGALRPTVQPVALDVHLYHMSTLFAKQLPVDWFLRKTKRRQKMLERLSRTQPIIIGEWSGVMSWETMRHVPKQQRDELFARYVALQQEVYGVTAGWFYWSYKTESPGQWNFRSQVEAGINQPDSCVAYRT